MYAIRSYYGHQAQLAVRVEQGGDFVFVPGAVHAGRIVGGEKFFAEVEDRGKIVDAHFADAQVVARRNPLP